MMGDGFEFWIAWCIGNAALIAISMMPKFNTIEHTQQKPTIAKVFLPRDQREVNDSTQFSLIRGVGTLFANCLR